MKTFFAFWAACLALPLSAFAQYAFEKGALVLQPGIGYGLVGTAGTVEVPPVSLNLEFASGAEWSIGGYVGYASSRETYLSSGNTGGWWDRPDYGVKVTHLIFGGRLSYHMNTESEKWDPYAGVMLGYNAVSVSEWGGGYGNLASLSVSGILYGGQLGFRYYLSPAMGLFVEGGYGIGYLTAGLSFKLGGKGRTEMPETDEARKTDHDIWQRWNERVSRAEMEEAEAEVEEEMVVRARILERKQNLFILDAGQNQGLQAGMSLKVYPAFEDGYSGKHAFPARITEARARHAIVKISNANLAAMLAIGDELVMKVLSSHVENY